MMGFGLVFTIGVIALIAYLIGWRPSQIDLQLPKHNQQTPLEILKTRYAQVEISKEEFETMSKDLM